MPSSVGYRLVATWHALFALLAFTGLTVGTSVPPDRSWEQYVRAPSHKTVRPVQWLEARSKGNITNPGALIGNGYGVTTLTRSNRSDEMPSLVLDFGQNHVGILSIDFAGSETFSEPERGLPGITLAFSESLQYLTDRSDFTRSDNMPDGEKLTHGTDQIAVQRTPYTWTDSAGCQHSTISRGAQVCSDGLHGFRYLRISLQALRSDAPHTAPHGRVAIAGVALASAGFRGTPATFRGWFECSDAALTQWWFDAVYTNDLATDVFRAGDADPRRAAGDASAPGLRGRPVLHDGAKRDRDPYVGDLAVSALTLYMSHHAPAAARNVLADLAAHQRADGWLPPASINNYTLPLYDYPLWWVVCSSDLVLYAGDMAYLREYYATMLRVLDVYYPSSTNAQGLLEKGLGTSEGYGDYAFLPRSGVITYYNALYVLALQRAAQLAVFHGKDDDAGRWTARAAAIGPALVQENWDASAGAFYDGGPCSAGGAGKCAVHAQDGNALAILSGIVGDADAADAALAYLAAALATPYGHAFYDASTLAPDAQFDARVYPFISYFELAARFHTAQRAPARAPPQQQQQQQQQQHSSSSIAAAAAAFAQLRRTYGHMAGADPFGTFWEGIGPGGGYYEGGYTSLAHGWATGVVALLQNYVLGVAPTAPGLAAVEVRPLTAGGGLAWARGRVPVAGGGGVGVAWRVGSAATGAGLRLDVDVPRSTVATVYVPVEGGDAVVARDGVVVWRLDGGVVGGRSDVVGVEDGRVVVVVEGETTATFTTGT